MTMYYLSSLSSYCNVSVVIISTIVVGVITLYSLFRQTKTKPPNPPLTLLQELNKEFHKQYEQARTNFWLSMTGNGTVIIAKGSSLTLIHKGTRYPTVVGIPKIYHDVKSIAHIPLTVNIMLHDNASTVSDITLKNYLEMLDKIELSDSIGLDGLNSAQMIISQSQTLIKQAVNDKNSVSRSQLTSYCQDLSEHLFTLLKIAAIAQLDLMHSIIQQWFKEYAIDQHDSTIKVLIISARTARENNLQNNYFERLLGSDRKENIIYIEELFQDEKKAISIFSTWFFDAQLGEIFFNDPDRMHRDLLMSKHAQQHLVSLIP